MRVERNVIWGNFLVSSVISSMSFWISAWVFASTLGSGITVIFAVSTVNSTCGAADSPMVPDGDRRADRVIVAGGRKESGFPDVNRDGAALNVDGGVLGGGHRDDGQTSQQQASSP